MNIEEIERLLRVVSDPLRHQWEIRKLNSRSLLDVKKSREDAIKLGKKSQRKSELWIGISVIPGVIFSLSCIAYSNGSGPMPGILLAWLTGITVLLGTGALWNSRRWRIVRESTGQTVSACDSIFENFKRSVDSLNPLGTGKTYWDLITSEYVSDKATGLAERVLDAEERFDNCRHKRNVSRYDVVYSGQWVDSCQGCFKRLWCAATNDFGIELDKADIYRKAAASLEKGKAPVEPR